MSDQMPDTDDEFQKWLDEMLANPESLEERRKREAKERAEAKEEARDKLKKNFEHSPDCPCANTRHSHLKEVTHAEERNLYCVGIITITVSSLECLCCKAKHPYYPD